MFSASKTSGPSGYNLTNSLRFRASASAYLNRTLSTPTNNKIWTWSAWVKRSTLTSTQVLFATSGDELRYIADGGASGVVDSFQYNLSTGTYGFRTNATYRDPSAWYHIVVAVDTTQATAANRARIYINGTEASTDGTYGIVQNANTQINSAVAHNIGRRNSGSLYFDGYLAEVNFIDGQQLTPSSFGSTNSTTGVWQPARYSGTYGTNGFYLNFTDIGLTSGSNTGLGKDFSGNGNYWTTNNISVTAGVTYDAMSDVPTLTSATVANYSTLNPLKFAGTLSNANLNLTATAASWQNASSTLFVNSGKWYFEATIIARPVTYGCMIGIGTPDSNISTTYGSGDTFTYLSDGTKYGSGSFGGAYGATFTAGDIIGVAFDCDAGTITFYKNNTSQGTAFSNLVAGSSYGVWLGVHTSASSIALNCGQRPFAYTPPSGFVALNTYNLPTSTIVKGNTVMDATTYTGTNGSPTTQVISSNFQPDFLWFKKRSAAYDHALIDTNRGINKQLYSNLTNAEGTDSDVLTAIGASSFTVGNSNYSNYGTLVAWTWKANGGTTSSNTQGSITSTVQANTTAGFSIVTYTGTGANATVGHGLGVAPRMIICKNRASATDWAVYHASVGNTGALRLNLTAATETDSRYWNNTTPTSTVFSIGSSSTVNGSSNTQVAYCWAEIAGFSRFGSYVGNGSADGPFVYLGFRPSFVMIKRTDTTSNWNIYDDARNTYNVVGQRLIPNTSDAEATVNTFDFLSNGLKLRTSDADRNASGGTYIYAAFAENPFKNALAR
jgi:hypothetical protein